MRDTTVSVLENMDLGDQLRVVGIDYDLANPRNSRITLRGERVTISVAFADLRVETTDAGE